MSMLAQVYNLQTDCRKFINGAYDMFPTGIESAGVHFSEQIKIAVLISMIVYLNSA